MLVRTKKVATTKVVNKTVACGIDFGTLHEAEATRASVALRERHIRAELEKPLSAGVASTLRTELSLLGELKRAMEKVCEGFKSTSK